jgi:Flp pilus assembly protein TadD
MSFGAGIQAADKAWTDAIAIDPSNPYAWSNRGTSRLQFGRWQDARDDLQKAFELESKNGEPSGAFFRGMLRFLHCSRVHEM